MINQPIRTLAVYTKCLALTGFYCLKILFLAWRKRLERKTIDDHARKWARYLIEQTGTRYTVEGLDSVRCEAGRAYIFMSNHVGIMDAVFPNLVFPPSIRFIAKKEAARYPLLGMTLKAGEYIFIDRGNLENAKRDLERAKTKMQSGIKLWIFPEGTRSRTGKLLPFKKGGFHLAIETEADIIPVGLIGTDLVPTQFSKGIRFDSQVRIRVGKPIKAAAYSKEQLTELIATTQQAIASLLETSQ